MAKGITSGGSQLNYTANLSIEEAIKKAQLLKKELNSIGIKNVDTKPLTAYQAEQLKIKQQAIDLAKQKQEQAKAEKSASMVLQDALKQERLAREAINTQIAANRLAQQSANQAAKEQAEIQKQIANQKRPTQVSNSPAEIAKYNLGTLGTNGQVNTAFTSYLREVKKDFDAGKISAQQYVAELERYSTVVTANTNATKNQSSTNKQTALSKRELAEAAAMEALKEKEATAALKNHAREMSNAKGSLEQRRAALIRLTTAYDKLSQVERNTAAGMRLGTIVKGLSQQIGELELATNRGQRSVGQYGGAFTQLKEQLLGAVTGYLSLYAVINAGKAIFENNVHLSDDFTDVQRTAKLSGEEVDRLGDKLKGLNTRTSLGSLLDIGFEGGRLGVQKDEIFDYIKTVDQLAVVLKKELPGGAEAISESLGKVSKIYKIAEREGITLAQAMNKVGSSQLELAHDGGVTVKYLQDFSLGLAGTAVTAKLSLPVIEGYGAVLSNSGQIASSASLALTRVVNDLSVKREKYYAIAQLADANLTLKEFTDLINNDTKGALDLFFKGLKAGNPVQTELADRLNSVGLKTGKVSNAVKVLAENQDLLTKKIGIATEAYNAGTSVAHNFELANNSLAASLEKIKNAIVNAFTDSSFSRTLAELLNSLTDTRTESEKLAQEYLNTKHSTEELEKAMEPLVKRYDELSSKSNLTTGEQDELKKVTAQIGELLPGVTTKFDQYGNAIAISRDRIRELTKAQRDLLLATNRDAINKANQEFTEFQRQASLQIQNVEEVARNVGKQYGRKKLSNSDVVENSDYLKILQGRAYESAKAIRDLGGSLTKAQQDVINFYEVVSKPKKKKDPNAEITGTGEIVEETPTDKTPAALKAEIKSLTAANAKLKVGSKELAEGVAKLKALKKELKLALGGTDTEGIKAENQYQSALKARNDLQEKISALTKKGIDKQLDANDQEVEGVKKKYADLLKAANDFNNNAKNKAKGLKVNAGGLDFAMGKEVDAVMDKGNAEKLKTQFESLKKLYDDYEAYKDKVGKVKADARYKDLLNVEQTYLQALQAKDDEIRLGDPKAKGGDAGGGEYAKLQLEFLTKEREAATAEERKKNDDLLFQFQTYVDKRSALQLAMTEKVNNLLRQGLTAEAEEARKSYAEQLLQLGESHVQQLDSYKKFFDDVEFLSTEALSSRLEALKADIAKLDSPELKELLNKLLRAGRAQLNSKTLDGYKSIVSSLQEAEQAADGLSSGLAEGLGVATKLGTSLINIKSSYDEFKQAQKDSNPLGMLTAGIAGVSSILSIANLVSGIFAKARQFKEESKKTIEDFNSKRFIAEFDINALYRERLRTQLEINQATLAGLKTNTAELKKQAQQVNDDYNRLADLLSKESYITGYKNETIKLQVTQVAQLASLAGKSFSDIEKLYMSGQLTDRAKELFTQLQKLKSEGVDIDKLLAENTKSIMEAATGTTAESIRDSIITGFENGYRTAKDFADDFQSLMSSATRQIFKEFIDNKELAAFYKQYADMAQNGALNVDQKATLKNLYDAMIGRINGKYEELKGITGTDFLADTSKDNTSVGTIQKNVTESTATEWIGLIRAQYDISKKIEGSTRQTSLSIGDLYVIAKNNFDVQLKIEANTFRTAENTEPLKAIRTGIDTLVKNSTSAGSTGYDRGK